MRTRIWLHLFVAAIFALGCSVAFAQDEGHGHGHGHGEGRNKHGDRDDNDRDHYGYSDHDRDSMRGWYEEHHEHLPPGLAKRDELPPGLERQLIVRGTLPPGLRKKLHRCPEDLEQRLPPPPPDYEHAVIGGHLVLINRSTYVVMDIFHFER